jgi:hypothetical protein
VAHCFDGYAMKLYSRNGLAAMQKELQCHEELCNVTYVTFYITKLQSICN